MPALPTMQMPAKAGIHWSFNTTPKALLLRLDQN
jgi:hypothetical protein